jgi:hypothetical protein
MASVAGVFVGFAAESSPNVRFGYDWKVRSMIGVAQLCLRPPDHVN